ncbi:MAG: hypothetical protein ACI8WT_004422 [Clostridium sp.]|jgi:hypothetical protein
MIERNKDPIKATCEIEVSLKLNILNALYTV